MAKTTCFCKPYWGSKPLTPPPPPVLRCRLICVISFFPINKSHSQVKFMYHYMVTWFLLIHKYAPILVKIIDLRKENVFEWKLKPCFKITFVSIPSPSEFFVDFYTNWKVLYRFLSNLSACCLKVSSCRFLQLVVSHPAFSKDEDLQKFLKDENVSLTY